MKDKEELTEGFNDYVLNINGRIVTIREEFIVVCGKCFRWVPAALNPTEKIP
jgi:hypothetical protein